jgi:pyridoxal 5'-phosphate synthase pdxS subunit
MSQNNGSNTTSLRLKTGLAEMLKGGVIMDVTNADQATIAERAGAVAVMALERVPAQIRAEGGVARMASPKKTSLITSTSTPSRSPSSAEPAISAKPCAALPKAPA